MKTAIAQNYKRATIIIGLLTLFLASCRSLIPGSKIEETTILTTISELADKVKEDEKKVEICKAKLDFLLKCNCLLAIHEKTAPPSKKEIKTYNTPEYLNYILSCSSVHNQEELIKMYKEVYNLEGACQPACSECDANIRLVYEKVHDQIKIAEKDQEADDSKVAHTLSLHFFIKDIKLTNVRKEREFFIAWNIQKCFKGEYHILIGTCSSCQKFRQWKFSHQDQYNILAEKLSESKLAFEKADMTLQKDKSLLKIVTGAQEEKKELEAKLQEQAEKFKLEEANIAKQSKLEIAKKLKTSQVAIPTIMLSTGLSLEDLESTFKQ